MFAFNVTSQARSGYSSTTSFETPRPVVLGPAQPRLAAFPQDFFVSQLRQVRRFALCWIRHMAPDLPELLASIERC